MVKPKNKKNGVKWPKNLQKKQILKNYLKRKKKQKKHLIWETIIKKLQALPQD